MKQTNLFLISTTLVIVAVAVYFLIKHNKGRLIDTLKGNEDERKLLRIAYIFRNTIVLCERHNLKGELIGIDIPMEMPIDKNESVTHGITRMLSPIYKAKIPDVRFSIKYISTEEGKTFEIFLFIIHSEDSTMPQEMNDSYKLWTVIDIESHLGKNIFTPRFEKEFPHLKLIIESWEKYD